MNLMILADEVSKIALEAGKAIMDIYENAPDVQIEQKSDQSPLTLADKASNQVICSGLEALAVKYPIVSEENKAIPYELRKTFEYHWVVDPLDGTKEFIKRNGEFTVNIALVHQQMPILGVVYSPCLNELYWAVKHEGAFLQKDGQTQRIEALAFGMKDPALKVVCSRSHMNEPTKQFINQLDTPHLVSIGSSLKFLLLAKGEAHIYPRLGPTMEWDTAAAQIVLEEAGGSVIDENTNAPLKYNKENLLNPYFIAYGKLN